MAKKEVKIKGSEVFNLMQAISSIENYYRITPGKELPTVVMFIFSKAKRSLQPHFQDLLDVINKVGPKYSEKDKEGKPISDSRGNLVFKDEKNRDKYLEEVKPFFDKEVAINFEFKLTWDEFKTLVGKPDSNIPMDVLEYITDIPKQP